MIPPHVLELIDSVYSAALAPQEFDAFMAAWGRHLESHAGDGAGAGAEAIIAHLERAREIMAHVRAGQDGLSRARDLVDRQGHPAWLAAGDGRVLHANAAGDALAGRRLGRVWEVVDSAAAQRSLADAVRRVAGGGETESDFLTGMLDSAPRPVLLAISALHESGPGEGPGEGSREGPAVLVRASLASWSDHMDGILARSFGLTAAETDICRLMSEGKTINETASARRRSIETVRAQVKSIYAKFGVVSQSELARLVTNLLLLSLDQPAAARGLAPADGDPRRLLRLPDGRRLAYRLRGDPRGRPFVFVHGMLLGHGIRRDLDRALAERGHCMVCVERPGYGLSDPPADWQRGVEDFAGSFSHLADHLDAPSLAVVSHTSGVLSACAAAAANPGRVAGILALAAGVPITRRAMIRRYPERIRIVAMTARHAPWALRFMFSTGARLFDRQGDEQMVRKNYEGSPVDHAALVADREVFDLVRAGHALTAERGYDGFCGDAVRIWGDWSDHLAGTGCPVTYLQGGADPICPAGWARDLAARHGHLRVATVAGAGQLLHHTHWRDVLAALTDFLDATA
ncbi:MAG: alpha/beta fold hydrolase [Hyphomicrobiales bacterium]|nr:alpha/beta fold hydrolase [Hyphomicrobiales bacterium]MCP5371619.1 alpha/beta fold hydrolase [Hyphomicrobiales bacterium]